MLGRFAFFFLSRFSLKPISLTVVGSTVLLGLSHSFLSASELGGSDDLHRLQRRIGLISEFV